MKLTGKIRYRHGFGQCLVLQVEYEGFSYGNDGYVDSYTSWRDARVEDLSDAVLNTRMLTPNAT